MQENVNIQYARQASISLIFTFMFALLSFLALPEWGVFFSALIAFLPFSLLYPFSVITFKWIKNIIHPSPIFHSIEISTLPLIGFAYFFMWLVSPITGLIGIGIVFTKK